MRKCQSGLEIVKLLYELVRGIYKFEFVCADSFCEVHESVIASTYMCMHCSVSYILPKKP